MIPAAEIIHASVVAIGMGGAVTSMEQLAIRRDYAPGGIFAWNVLEPAATGRPDVAARLRRLLFDGGGPALTFALRLAAAVAMLFFSPFSATGTGALWVFTAATLLVAMRQDYGQSGADQLVAIVAVALSGVAACRWSPAAMALGLWFITAQAILAYLTAGVAKLMSPVWRNTNAVGAIFNSGSYGTPRVARFLKDHPGAGRVLSWLVIVFECTFILVLVVDTPWREAILLAGVVFHLVNAFVMGLNDFFIAFVGTYPAVWWASTQP